MRGSPREAAKQCFAGLRCVEISRRAVRIPAAIDADVVDVVAEQRRQLLLCRHDVAVRRDVRPLLYRAGPVADSDGPRARGQLVEDYVADSERRVRQWSWEWLWLT